mmetsp:Transcript_55629/g.63870  ORF Transcript_55629/g.63870 Transcript_55629/m.63870 type:complete len:82 (+) Transcript_55629:144-389(+)
MCAKMLQGICTAVHSVVLGCMRCVADLTQTIPSLCVVLVGGNLDLGATRVFCGLTPQQKIMSAKIVMMIAALADSLSGQRT